MEEKLLGFLHRARRERWAGGLPGAGEFTFAEGKYAYRDLPLGEGPFAGQEVLWEDGRPVWAMNYLCRSAGPDLPAAFLGEALLAAPAGLPWPGPAEYAREGLTYRCAVNGTPDWFYGYAEVLQEGERLCEYAFHGGALRP